MAAGLPLHSLPKLQELRVILAALIAARGEAEGLGLELDVSVLEDEGVQVLSLSVVNDGGCHVEGA